MALSISQLNATVRRVQEIGAFGGGSREEPIPETTEMHWVQITSTSQTAGRYPGTRYDLDADAVSYTAQETVWVDTPNAEALATGTYYLVKLVGVRASDGIAIYQTPPVSTAATFSGATVIKTGTQSVNDSTFAILTWEEEVDVGGYFDTGANTLLTAPETARYLVLLHVQWVTGGGGTGYGLALLQKNSTIIKESLALYTSGGLTNQLSMILSLNIGDDLDVNVFQTTGSAKNVGVHSSFAIMKLN